MTTSEFPDEQIVRDLQDMARLGFSVVEMIEYILIAGDYESDAAFPVVVYLATAFQLPLMQIREVERCRLFAGSISDDELDDLLLPGFWRAIGDGN